MTPLAFHARYFSFVREPNDAFPGAAVKARLDADGDGKLDWRDLYAGWDRLETAAAVERAAAKRGLQGSSSERGGVGRLAGSSGGSESGSSDSGKQQQQLHEMANAELEALAER